MKGTVVPLTLMALTRAPLARSPRFPRGRLEPHLGLGFAAAYSRMRVDYRPEAPAVSDRSIVGGGVAVRAGMAVRTANRLAVLAEYRFTGLRFETGIESGTSLRRTLKTHQGLLGVRVSLTD